MVATYQLLVRYILHYAVPVWFTNAAPSNVEKLQRVQNSAPIIATGCVRRTPIAHLPEEIRVMFSLSVTTSIFCASSSWPEPTSQVTPHTAWLCHTPAREVSKLLSGLPSSPPISIGNIWTLSGTPSGVVPTSTFF